MQDQTEIKVLQQQKINLKRPVHSKDSLAIKEGNFLIHLFVQRPLRLRAKVNFDSISTCSTKNLAYCVIDGCSITRFGGHLVQSMLTNEGPLMW